MKQVLLRTLLFSATSFLSLQMQAENKLERWQEIPLPQPAMCARGTPYSFFVSPGSTNKIVIDFVGGGGCWDKDTCAHETKTYLESIEEFKKEHSHKLHGVYDRDSSQNPLKDWTHILVAYCTGDLHWGENDHTYTKEDNSTFEIKHRGAVNAKAVLKWTKENFPNPENVLVTGTSAGAYASIFWLPYIHDFMYPQAMIFQLGDSGISPVTEKFAKIAFSNWNIRKNGPVWVPSLDPEKLDWSTIQIHDLYAKLTDYYKNINFGQITSAFDGNQRFFYWLMGGDASIWPELIKTSLHELSKSSHFHYFITPGSQHCVLPTADIYSMKATDGTKLQNWIESFLSGNFMSNKDCVGCSEEEFERESWAHMKASEMESHHKDFEIEL